MYQVDGTGFLYDVAVFTAPAGICLPPSVSRDAANAEYAFGTFQRENADGGLKAIVLVGIGNSPDGLTSLMRDLTNRAITEGAIPNSDNCMEIAAEVGRAIQRSWK